MMQMAMQRIGFTPNSQLVHHHGIMLTWVPSCAATISAHKLHHVM